MRPKLLHLFRFFAYIICLFSLVSLEAQPLSVQIDTDPITCNGSSDAACTANPTGGTPPYIYSWSNGETTQSIDNLPPGTYSVIVRDVLNATAMDMVTITDPSPITWVVATNYTTCATSSDATASVVSIQGGKQPYSFNWSTGDTTATITGLSVGTYTLFIEDANGCQQVDYVDIEVSPEGIWLMPLSTDVLCFGETNGSIYAGVMTGTPPFSYAWSDPSLPDSSTVTDVPAGTYGVTVTDANGCTGTEEATVVEPPVLELEVTANNVLCPSGLLGSAIATANGGASDYSYLWNTGDTTAIIADLPSGTYTVEVTDSNGCTAIEEATVFAPDPLTISMSTKLETCPGAFDGAVFVDSIFGGTAPYSVSWAGLPDTTLLLTDRAAGIYTVLVTDALGCTGEASTEIERSPEGLWVAAMLMPITCPEESDGAIDATPMNGTPPYSYRWSPAFLGDTNFIDGLGPGTYFVTVTDANGCDGVDTAVLLAPANFEISLDVTDPNCLTGETGAIRSTVTGGTLPYTYLWSNDSTTADIVNIPPGTYKLTVTDANGCTAEETATVNAVSDIIWTVVSSPITCEQACNGFAGISEVSGGVPPYTFLWNTGDTTQFVDSLCGGTYEVIIEDQSGCFGIAYIDIDTSSLMLDVEVINPTCAGDSNGQVIVTPLNGDAPYIYRWNDPEVDDNNIITDLKEGMYIVTVTDANGCVAVDTANVVEPAALALRITKVDDDCKNGFNGSAAVLVTGGTSPYRYKWNTNQETAFIGQLPPGVYSVTVTDTNDCTATDSVEILGSNPEAGTLTADADNVCLVNGSATLEATTDGNAFIPDGYQVIYLLTTGVNQVITLSNLSPSFNVNGGGTFTIHTLVYDPVTFDLNLIIPGTSTIDDILNLIEPLGDICADLDADGATVVVDNPDASTITANADNVCLENGRAVLSATPDGNAVVPNGYQILYVLTQGPGLVIVQTNNVPTFIVNSGGLYTIHTLVFDPATLDLSGIVLGTTTAAEVLDLITPLGDICADLDAEGAPIQVDDPDAGTITADADNVCLVNGSANLTATPDGNDNVPQGYQTLYVLTQGPGLVIVQVNNVPDFTVNSGGLYTIHTLVFDPNTLDLNLITLGVTTAAEVLDLIAPIGDICADLDAEGAPIQVDDPDAGTITADADNVCLVNGSANLTATPDGNDNVPPGYQTLYVLTQGPGLVIVQVNNLPDFTVNSGGLYTIHTLVFDPNTLDLNLIIIGVTTAAEVLDLVAPIGDICADLDAEGAPIQVDDPDAGTITADADNVCLVNGSANLTATPDGNDNVPPGYQTLYVLTQGPGLVIVQVNNLPDFTVNSGGLYTIHTLVFDPNTLDLNLIIIGVTTAAEMLDLITPIGDICADLDAEGAPIRVDDPDAGTITADADNVCLVNGLANLTATPDGNDNVPPGYQTLYVLTQGPGLVIVQVNNLPDFTVNSGGLYTIHTLVFDPNTLDLNLIIIGVTTAAEVLDLIAPIGDICADLDAEGAPIQVDEPDAGTITADDDNVCLINTSVIISATPDGNAVVPAGYQTLYVLTQGAGLVIVQTNNTPEFTVNSGGLYTIHTLIFNPNTLDLNVIIPGTTTAAEVLNLISPIGDICADLDAEGAPIQVVEPDAGTLSILANSICLENGSATISATFNNNGNIPAGFQRTFLLTRGANQRIIQRAASPTFTVTNEDTYSVHAFVYDPITFDINTIIFNVTTINDIANAVAPIGGICADIDVNGDDVLVEDCGICINVGDFVWYDIDQDGVQDLNEPGIRNFKVYLMTAGADGAFGTSDDLRADVDITNFLGKYEFECVPPGIYRIVFPDYQLDTDEMFTSPNVGDDERDSDANPSTGATIPFAVTINQVDDDLKWDAGIIDKCIDVIHGGEICCDQTICEGETPAEIFEIAPIQGGQPGAVYMWMFTTDPLSQAVINWQPIPGSNSINYQPGPLFETTSFIRCVRNPLCTVFEKESNAVTITVQPAGSPGCPNPIQNLIVVVNDERSARLSWSITHEMQHTDYVIEHSTNGKLFSEIDMMAGKGLHQYNYMHENITSGMHYYRLRTEMFGQFLHYSDTEAVMIGQAGGSNQFTLYPNPTYDNVQIQSLGKMVYDGYIEVFNAAGQRLQLLGFAADDHLNAEIELQHAAKGIYTVRIIYNNSEKTVDIYRVTKL